MKITNENIDKLGIKLEINVPDEIVRDGIYYEIQDLRPAKKGEYILHWNYSVYKATEDIKDSIVVLRPIPRPTQEWLDELDWATSEKPVIVKFKDTIYVEDGYGAHMRWISEYDDLIGKRRYHLTERIRKECFNCGEKI